MQRTVGVLRVVFFVLDATILKPDLYLFLGQLECVGDFDASQSGEVLTGGEFTFQLQELSAGKGRSNPFAGFVDVADGSGW